MSGVGLTYDLSLCYLDQAHGTASSQEGNMKGSMWPQASSGEKNKRSSLKVEHHGRTLEAWRNTRGMAELGSVASGQH